MFLDEMYGVAVKQVYQKSKYFIGPVWFTILAHKVVQKSHKK